MLRNFILGSLFFILTQKEVKRLIFLRNLTFEVMLIVVKTLFLNQEYFFNQVWFLSLGGICLKAIKEKEILMDMYII